jgi:hypothetical protein
VEAQSCEKSGNALTVREESPPFPNNSRSKWARDQLLFRQENRKKPMGNSIKNRKRGRSGWRIAIIAIAGVTLLACGLLITLDVRKVAVEKKVDQKSATEKTMSKVAPELPLQPQPDNN